MNLCKLRSIHEILERHWRMSGEKSVDHSGLFRKKVKSTDNFLRTLLELVPFRITI